MIGKVKHYSLASQMIPPMYCRIQIKSTPFRDHDTPDENFFSSPYFGSRDMVKISSVESHMLTTIGVKIIAAVRRWSEN